MKKKEKKGNEEGGRGGAYNLGRLSVRWSTSRNSRTVNRKEAPLGSDKLFQNSRARLLVHSPNEKAR
jgi:hypothetical protein